VFSWHGPGTKIVPSVVCQIAVEAAFGADMDFAMLADLVARLVESESKRVA